MDGYIKKLRQKVGSDKVITNFAVACIENDKGEILLQKRGDEGFRGKWGLPGGALELDESFDETVVREAKEKTGLDISVEKLIGVYSKYFTTYPNGDVSQTISVLFLCRPLSSKFIVDHKETLELCYFDKDNVPKLFNQQNEDMVNDWENGRFEVFR